MDAARAFRPFGLAHLVVIALTIALPFVLAAFVRKSRWPRCERVVGRLLAVLLLVNYLGYEIYLALTVGLSWEKALPFQLCDWAMIAIIVALLTGRERWLEVAYFWGIGGTAQAILTPDLQYAFPDIRFLSFFIGHSGIVVGIAFCHDHARVSPAFQFHLAHLRVVGGLLRGHDRGRSDHRRELRLPAA